MKKSLLAAALMSLLLAACGQAEQAAPVASAASEVTAAASEVTAAASASAQ